LQEDWRGWVAWFGQTGPYLEKFKGKGNDSMNNVLGASSGGHEHLVKLFEK
jgi:hypothetical protein